MTNAHRDAKGSSGKRPHKALWGGALFQPGSDKSTCKRVCCSNDAGNLHLDHRHAEARAAVSLVAQHTKGCGHKNDPGLKPDLRRQRQIECTRMSVCAAVL